MEKLEESHGESHNVSIQWRSYELRPHDAPPISAEYRAKIEANRPRVYEIARTQYGLEMNPGPFGFNSRPAQIGAKYAEAQGKGPAYHAAILNGYWQEAKAIGEIDVLVEIAASVGLDAEEFRTALTDEAYTEAVLADQQQAFQNGISGVPAMVFVDKYLVSGAQPYEVLSDTVEKIAEEEGEPQN